MQAKVISIQSISSFTQRHNLQRNPCNPQFRPLSLHFVIKCVAISVRETRKKKNHFHTKFEFFVRIGKNIFASGIKKSPIVTHTGHITSHHIYYIQTYLGGIKKERYPRKTSSTGKKIKERTTCVQCLTCVCVTY